MIKYFMQGLLLGIAYVAPIGMQNLFVINTAISKAKPKAYQVAIITVFFDISLALACFFGVGTLLERYFLAKVVFLFCGSIIVTYIGLKLVMCKSDIESKVNTDKSILEVILSCFMVTWANPQAIIDGSLLLGGYKAALPYNEGKLFILGVCLASFLWFNILTTIVLNFKNILDHKLIRIINFLCGITIIYYGIKLGVNFLGIIGSRVGIR